jgi:hypothetical protein
MWVYSTIGKLRYSALDCVGEISSAPDCCWHTLSASLIQSGTTCMHSAKSTLAITLSSVQLGAIRTAWLVVARWATFDVRAEMLVYGYATSHRFCMRHRCDWVYSSRALGFRHLSLGALILLSAGGNIVVEFALHCTLSLRPMRIAPCSRCVSYVPLCVVSAVIQSTSLQVRVREILSSHVMPVEIRELLASETVWHLSGLWRIRTDLVLEPKHHTHVASQGGTPYWHVLCSLRSASSGAVTSASLAVNLR